MLLEGVGDGEEVGEGVGVGLGLGIGLGIGVGEGVGLGVGDGLDFGAALLIKTPLSQESFLPFFVQVNFLPPIFFVNPTLGQAAPDLGGAAVTEGVNEKISERATRAALPLTARMINVNKPGRNQ